MFNILSLSGGGKEQRCRVGRLEESSVANSSVNIIPHHLLPVKAQAKFDLCCTHGSRVAKCRETLSGQHEHRRVRSHKTMPTVTPTAEFKYKKAVLKMSGKICYMLLRICEDSRAMTPLLASQPELGKSTTVTTGVKEPAHTLRMVDWHSGYTAASIEQGLETSKECCFFKLKSKIC